MDINFLKSFIVIVINEQKAETVCRISNIYEPPSDNWKIL